MDIWAIEGFAIIGLGLGLLAYVSGKWAVAWVLKRLRPRS